MSREMIICRAELCDLNEIVRLLQDDTLGQSRESVSEDDFNNYERVFKELYESQYFDVFVMKQGEEIIGCYQMMYLPHLSFKGIKRGQVESVRVRADLRGKGLGTQLMKHVIQIAKENGCGILQLTSNKQRVEANKFYRNLGFEPTHDGYKLYF